MRIYSIYKRVYYRHLRMCGWTLIASGFSTREMAEYHCESAGKTGVWKVCCRYSRNLL